MIDGRIRLTLPSGLCSGRVPGIEHHVLAVVQGILCRYREYLEALGEDAVRHQLANQTLRFDRDGLARAWLADKAMAREDAQDRRRLIIRILVVACCSSQSIADHEVLDRIM